MSLKLTIVTVNFNNREGLIRTAKSVFTQLIKPYEWIIIDGGSTDGSIDILYDYINSQKKTNININIISEADKGIYDAMNKGVDISNGEYLIFLNSGDNFVNECCITKIDELVSKYPSVDFFQFGFIYMGIKRYAKPLWWNIWKMNSSHQATIFSKKIFNYFKYNLDFKYGADYELINSIRSHNFSHKSERFYLIENELYGSKDMKEVVELEYLNICKLHYPCVICHIISFFRKKYNYFINV